MLLFFYKISKEKCEIKRKMLNFFKKKKEVKEKPKNLKLISLCLAFEVANSDNNIDSTERELILNKIRDSVDLDILSEREIFCIIKAESEKKVSFYDLIYDLNKNLSKNEKIDVLKMLWEVAYADEVLDVNEEKIVKRSAEMLGIKPSIVLKTKDEFRTE